MLLDPRAPCGVDGIAWLQNRLHGPRAARPHHAEMAPMLTRHQLGDDAGFAMPPNAENERFVTPFHGGAFEQYVNVRKPHAPPPARLRRVALPSRGRGIDPALHR